MLPEGGIFRIFELAIFPAHSTDYIPGIENQFMKHYLIVYFSAFLIISADAPEAQAQSIITTIGGNGITQYIGDGWPATGLSLAQPVGLCKDKLGNIIIVDYADSRLRKIDEADTLFTISGSAGPGYAGDGGPATAAQYKNPASLCFDTAGNLFIADQYNEVIREIYGATGKIATICGTGVPGFSGDNGPASAAQVNKPAGICADLAGNIYIADNSNNVIRKISSATGIITTIAGNNTSGFSGDNGPATAAKLSFPNAVCTDSAGNLWISDLGNNRVRKITASTGIITTVAGTGVAGYNGDNGLATNSKINSPNSVYMSIHGNLYLSDEGNNRVRMVSAAGIITTVAGSGGYGFTGDGGPATNATFNRPACVFADDSENLYIADGLNSAIRKVSPVTTGINTLEFQTGFKIYPDPSEGRFTIETERALDNSDVTVYDLQGRRIFSDKMATSHLELNLGDYPPGIYFIQLKSINENLSGKITLMK